MAAFSFQDLFDPDFLAALQRFELKARRVARGGRYAEQASRALGHGLEFTDFKAYSTGDDLRAIDWNVYRRLGKLFVKVFEEQQDLPLYLLVDVSQSMFLHLPRARAALRAALAFAAVSLNQHDSVGLFPFAEQVAIKIKSTSGKKRILPFAQHLADLEPLGQTNLSDSLHRLTSLNLRPGLLVVISDFFDPGGLEKPLEMLRRSRHRLLLTQVMQASDGRPDLSGDLRLRDCETGDVSDVTVTPAVLKRYREAYERFNDTLSEFATRRQAGLLQLDADQDVLEQLGSLFGGGRLLV